MSRVGYTTRRGVANKMRTLLGVLGTMGLVGNVFFVNNTATGASNLSTRGTDPSVPLSTIDYAIRRCTAAHGDIIVVMPGHAETINTNTVIVCNVSGIRFIGVGVGRNRPTLTWSTLASATIVVSVANISWENFVFDLTGVDAIVSGFTCDAADDCAFRNCEFITNSGTAGCVTAITFGATTACNRWIVEGCHFWGPATNSGTTTTAQITYTKGTDFICQNNKFTGKMTQAITNAAAVLRGWIHNNVFVVYTGTKAINVHASSTPMCSNNRINVPSGTAPIVAAAGFMSGNNYSAAAGVTAGTASTF